MSMLFSEKFSHVNRNLLESIFGNHLKDHQDFIECRLIKKDSAPTQRFYRSLSGMFSDDSLNELHGLNEQGYNIYFGVCPRIREKGKKEDVAHATTLWADLDAKDYPGGKSEAWERLMKFEIAPSAIVDSGHGYHGYWFLSETVDVTDPKQFEGCVKGIAHILGSDSVHDVSRVLRLPGFINVKEPNNPVPCVLLQDFFFPERQYTLQDFMCLWVPSDDKSRAVVLDNVPKEIPPRFLALLKTDAKLAATWNGTRKLPNDNSRSGFDMSLAQQLKKYGFTDGQIASVLVQSPSGKGQEATQQYLLHTIAKTDSSLSEAVPEQGFMEVLELVSKETPKHELPDALDEFFRLLASHPPAKVASVLRYFVKDRFRLTLSDIKTYEKTVAAYKKQYETLAEGADFVSDGIDWVNALQGGVTDGKTYELDLVINGKPVHLDDIDDKSIEKPDHIARRCRHILKDTSISCSYSDNPAGLAAWLKNVLSVWLPKIKGDTSSDSLGMGLAWLRKYCDFAISIESMSAPFKQSEHVVKDGPNLLVPYAGFHGHIRKKNDKATADKCARVTLESVGAVRRKGGGRTTFYEISSDKLYDVDFVPVEARSGQDNAVGGSDEENVEPGEVGSGDVFREEERQGYGG